MPTYFFAVGGADVDNDEEEDAEDEGRNVSEDNVFENKVDHIEVLARCEGLAIDEACDEDDPKIGSDAKGHSPNNAYHAEHAV